MDAMNTGQEIGQMLAAVHFAAEKHRNQRRKGAAQAPYINHPIEVAELLWSVGGVRELPVLVAAILHDTIEDTDAGPDEIRRHFGETVLGLVLELSDDKSLPKQERKRLQIETAPKKSFPAKCIKLADFISNVRDLSQSPPADWPLERLQEYLLWSEMVVAGLRGTNAGLEACYDLDLANGKKKVNI
jgi:GTP diphosphokinase / guanosine-3',5'-bis(diphosphate) 3'-diphosphatase